MLTAPVRLLGDGDRRAIQAVLEREPVAGAQVAELASRNGVDWWRSGARLYGYGDRYDLEALCWFGSNLIPVGAGPRAIAAFSMVGRVERRRCSSMVGPADAVLGMWRQLRHCWGPARDVRGDQPLLVADQPPTAPSDPAVAPVEPGDVDILLPAAVAMYTAEVGVSPVAGFGGEPYRRRVRELVSQRRAYARIENGEVLFKADLAVLTPRTAQIQGVWVPPHLRRRGLATAGVSAVVRDALARGIPTVSLYVNSHNVSARRVYERCGFREIGRFATVLF